MAEYTFVLAGRVGVGKSSIFHRLSHNEFLGARQQNTTLRYDSGVEKYDYDTTVGGKPVMVSLWDTGGLERYESMTANYYRYCHAVILVYDMEAEDSLFCLKDWIIAAQTNSRWPDKLIFSLWGNKCDSDDRGTSEEGLEAFLTEYNISKSLDFRVTAKQGASVEKAFQKVVETVDDSFSTVERDTTADHRDTAWLNFSFDAKHAQSPRYAQRKCCS